jgi:maleate isomerase
MRTALAMSHQFDALLDQLPRATGSSRTTLRLDWPELGFHVDDFAGKALVPGEKSLRGQRGINQRAVATVQWLDRERRSLIQDDFTTTDVPSLPALIEVCGPRAQMFAPVIRNGALQDGFLSTTPAPRIIDWSHANVEAIGDGGAAGPGIDRQVVAG